MQRLDRRRRVYIGFLLITCSGLLVLGGAALGYVYAMRPAWRAIRESKQLQSLGAAFEHAGLRIEEAAAAYEDPERARREMDQYCYTPEIVATPFVGYMTRPGTTLTAEVNAAQMRSTRELESPKPPGVFRMFVTGGSAAFGVGAPDNSTTIGGFIESTLRDRRAFGQSKRIEVMTAACPAWTSTHERILIENRISEFEPDLVIAFSGSNDTHFGNDKTNTLWMRGYGDWVFWEIASSAWRRTGNGNLHDPVEVLTERPSPNRVADRLARNVLLGAYALETLESGSVPYVFVLQPTLAVTGKELSVREAKIMENTMTGRFPYLAAGGLEYFRACYEAIRTKLGSLRASNFHFVDASRMFDSANSSSEIFLDSFHFGDRGNRMIAEFIASELASVLATHR